MTDQTNGYECFAIFISGFDKDMKIYSPDGEYSAIVNIDPSNLDTDKNNQENTPLIKYVGYYWGLCVIVADLDILKLEDDTISDGRDIPNNSYYIKTKFVDRVIERHLENGIYSDKWDFHWFVIPMRGNEGLETSCARTEPFVRDMSGASGGKSFGG